MSSKKRNGLSCSEAGRLGYEKTKVILKENKRKRIEEYNRIEKKCKRCGIKITYEKRLNVFCSKSCSASFNNIGICRTNKTICRGRVIKNKMVNGYSEKVEKFCKSCDGKLKTGKTFCSLKCQQIYKWKETKQKIEKAKNVAINKIFNSHVAKRYLKEVRGIKCEICNITEWNKKEVPLVLDHINGNAEDWDLSNLRLICGNCDMQTDTYKGKNMGHGRHWRKMRYREGKSS